MKKIKWILLIITIFLIIVLIFGTCKKTKALEPGYYEGNYFSLNSRDSNAGCIFYYYPTDTRYQDLMKIRFVDTIEGTNEIYFSLHENKLKIYWGTWVDTLDYTLTSTTTLCCVYVVVAPNDNDNADPALSINYGYIYYDGTDFQDRTKYYYFNNIAGQLVDAMNAQYASNGIYIYPNVSNTISFTGMFNGNIFDWFDYQTQTFSEYVPDLKDDYLAYAKSNFLTYLYNVGYDNGYQTGYDDGYSAGQTAGYNAGYSAGQTAGYQSGWDDGYAQAYDDYYIPRYNQGYNAGYQAGVNDNQAAYDQGYSAGYQDGWSAGRVYGLNEGYQDGYTDGLNDGMAGATPMSQATTLIGSLFTGIGSILSIQLFPGFPLGLLILVPLFFSVLGLILWIWRRN